MKPDFVIEPDKIRQLARRPHDPVHFSDALLKKIYTDKLWATHLQLERLLIGSGFKSYRSNPNGNEYDFYTNDDVGPYRLLSFEMSNRRMIGRGLLEKIAEFLQELEDEYIVFISNEFDDADLELFMIIVARDKVFGAFETRQMAERFGFDPASGPIGPIK